MDKIQALVNERDELEHKKLAADNAAVRYPKGSQKLETHTQAAKEAAQRIEEIDRILKGFYLRGFDS